MNKAIEKAKAKLIAKCEDKGIYENFGQNEVRKLGEKYIDLSDYTDKMNSNRAMLREFDNWCMTYNGKEEE